MYAETYRELARAEHVKLSKAPAPIPRTYNHTTLELLISHSSDDALIKAVADMHAVDRLYTRYEASSETRVAEFIVARHGYVDASIRRGIDVFDPSPKRGRPTAGASLTGWSHVRFSKHTFEGWTGLYLSMDDCFRGILGAGLPTRTRPGRQTEVYLNGDVLLFMRSLGRYSSFSPLHPVAVDMNRRAAELLNAHRT